MAIKRLSHQALIEAAECLRVLAHPHRLAMVQLLLRRPLSVGRLGEELGLASNVCSEHLRLLERCGFLKREKQGRFVLYSVVEPQLAKIMKCVEDRFEERR